MNNVQFITWKPIYWIQHLALSPRHLFFNTFAKKKKKERKAGFNSQSHFRIVFYQGNPCCKHIFLSKKLSLQWQPLHICCWKGGLHLSLLPLRVSAILLLILPCHIHIQGYAFLILANLIFVQWGHKEMINKSYPDNNYSKTSLREKTTTMDLSQCHPPPLKRLLL